MIGSDYDTPVMYQDLGAYTMNPMMPGVMPGMMPGMYGIGATNYLGGVRMQPILCEDKLQLMDKKDNEGNKTAKKVGLAVGAILLLGFIPYIGKNIKKAGGIKKYIAKGWDAFKNLFKSNPTPPPATKPSKWQRFKNFFKRKPKP